MTGFCPALLRDITDWYVPAPSDKVTETGFLTSLLQETNKPTVINEVMSNNGHTKSALVRYMPRSVISQAHETFDCGIDKTPAFKETTVSIAKKVQVGLFFEVDTIRQYCEDASRTQAVGAPPTQMMEFVRKAILTNLNSAYQKMETRLLQSLKLACPSAVTVNLPLAGTQMDLANGIQKMLGELQDAEFCGIPTLVGGSNLFRNYDAIAGRNAFGMNQSGMMNTTNADWNFYYSKLGRTLLGTEDIAAIDPGSVGLLEAQLEVGSFAGQHGTSHFGVFSDPRMQCVTGTGYQNMLWDMQVKELDCATTLTDSYTGVDGTFNRGYAVYLRKAYDLWVTPSDVYDGADVNAGQRGIKYFTISNS